ncbi:MAG: chemotaxis protein CheX [Acidobacteriota bacterium]
MEQWTEKIAQAVSAVFQSMIGSKLEQSDGEMDPGQLGLTAVIGLTGSPAGILTVSSKFAAASKIAVRMLGNEMSGSEEYARDALGEVCNMVAGNLKSSLPKPEDRCQLSVPTVISGANYQIKSLLYGEKHSVTFRFEGEPILITLQIQH